MKNTILPALALPLLLTACLENEETVEVRPDGSVHVRVLAKGDILDLTEGYAVPLDGPWVPKSGDAHLWLEHVGHDTGSSFVQVLPITLVVSGLGVPAAVPAGDSSLVVPTATSFLAANEALERPLLAQIGEVGDRQKSHCR